ncbi:MAG: disulfide bond formation protein B [Pseudomonadota bacterium]
MRQQLTRISQSAYYWLAVLMIGISFEAVGLYYQHVLGEAPCVLCIHVRLWLMALILVALVALLQHPLRFRPVPVHLLTVIISAGLLERSYRLLGTERGFVVGNCGFDLGLPAWFTPDQWLPALFQVQDSCGYTPKLPFGISMAEALIVVSAAFVWISVTMLVAAGARKR